MKSKNLIILSENGIKIPPFICVSHSAEIDLSFSNKEVFAVRSSFSNEDGMEYSYAGQFTTLLSVKKDEVKHAVDTVIKDARQQMSTYQKAHSIEENGTMQVIIQEMVEADLSGVLFTANPQGILNEMVLVAGKGLGNQVVEDKTPTTTYYYNRDDEQCYYELQTDSPILKEEIVNSLFDYGKQIQNIFGKPMDIEYAIQDEEIFFLQARPITTLHKEEHTIILDNSNIVESYPGISLPLTQSFVKEVYGLVFQSCIDLLTDSKKIHCQLEKVLKNMVDTVNGRIYYRIENWYQVLQILPFSEKIIPIWQEMLGVSNKQFQRKSDVSISIYEKGKILKNFIHLLRVTPKKMDELNQYFSRNLAEYQKRLEEADTIEKLFELYENLAEDLGKKWGITLANDMYAFLYTALAKRQNEQKIYHIKQLESLKPLQALEQLVNVANKSGMKSEAYRVKRAVYIEAYGDRCLEELKLETKTIRTNPTQLDEYIKNQLRNKNQTVALSNTKNLMEKESLFVRKAKQGILNRELSRMNRSRIYGIVRQLFYKVSEELIEQDLIEEAEDIFWLYQEEIKKSIGKNKSMKALIEERKRTYKLYEELPVYTRLVFQKDIFNKAPVNINSHISSEEFIDLRGVPCSCGVVEGEVLVVEKAELSLEIKDKILVTKITDPGWVFLIQNAKGVITEKGSLLSHTAIITRELHKPAVVSVPGITGKLKNGDFIRLNGDTGEITLLKKKESDNENSYIS